MNKFYTYIYLDPTKPGKFKYDGLEMTFLFRPFYVGKGKRGRVWAHISQARDHRDKNTHKCNTIRKILKDYGELELRDYVVFPHQNISNAKSRKLEVQMIALIGRHDQPDKRKKKGPLTNETDGGEGSSGYKQSKEHINKREDSKKKNGTANSGARNGNACKFLIVEPNGKEHIFLGGYISWVREHNVSEYLLKKWMDKGPICGRLYKKMEYMRGWSAQHI
jgi:hypothetical protein